MINAPTMCLNSTNAYLLVRDSHFCSNHFMFHRINTLAMFTVVWAKADMALKKD